MVNGRTTANARDRRVQRTVAKEASRKRRESAAALSGKIPEDLSRSDRDEIIRELLILSSDGGDASLMQLDDPFLEAVLEVEDGEEVEAVIRMMEENPANLEALLRLCRSERFWTLHEMGTTNECWLSEQFVRDVVEGLLTVFHQSSSTKMSIEAARGVTSVYMLSLLDAGGDDGFCYEVVSRLLPLGDANALEAVLERMVVVRSGRGALSTICAEILRGSATTFGEFAGWAGWVERRHIQRCTSVFGEIFVDPRTSGETNGKLMETLESVMCSRLWAKQSWEMLSDALRDMYTRTDGISYNAVLHDILIVTSRLVHKAAGGVLVDDGDAYDDGCWAYFLAEFRRDARGIFKCQGCPECTRDGRVEPELYCQFKKAKKVGREVGVALQVADRHELNAVAAAKSHLQVVGGDVVVAAATSSSEEGALKYAMVALAKLAGGDFASVEEERFDPKAHELRARLLAGRSCVALGRYFEALDVLEPALPQKARRADRHEEHLYVRPRDSRNFFSSWHRRIEDGNVEALVLTLEAVLLLPLADDDESSKRREGALQSARNLAAELPILTDAEKKNHKIFQEERWLRAARELVEEHQPNADQPPKSAAAAAASEEEEEGKKKLKEKEVVAAAEQEKVKWPCRRWRWTKFGELSEVVADRSINLKVEVVPALHSVVVQADSRWLQFWDYERRVVRGWIALLSGDSWTQVTVAKGTFLVIHSPSDVGNAVCLDGLRKAEGLHNGQSMLDHLVKSVGSRGGTDFALAENLKTHFARVGCLASHHSPSSLLLATCGDAEDPLKIVLTKFDNELAPWGPFHDTLSRGVTLRQNLLGHASSVTSLAFGAPDLLASGDDDNLIRLWRPTPDATTQVWSCTGTLRGCHRTPTCLAATPDFVFAAAVQLSSGDRRYYNNGGVRSYNSHDLAVDTDNRIGVWATGAADGNLLTVLRAKSKVKSLAVLGKTLLVSQHDDPGGTINIWKLLPSSSPAAVEHLASYALRLGERPMTALAADNTTQHRLFVASVGALFRFDLNPEVTTPCSSSEPHSNCAHCGIFDPNASRKCDRCHKVKFCDLDCLKAGWDAHRPNCTHRPPLELLAKQKKEKKTKP